MPLVAARGDLPRFEHPRQLMNYLGLIPSESSRGERRRQGTSTKAGPTHSRRALVEGPWASRYPANVSRHVQRRLEQLPKSLQDLSGKAHVRLCTRVCRLLARGNHAKQVVVASARALAGFLGVIAREVPVTPSSHKTERPCLHDPAGLQPLPEATKPQCGAPLDSVKRPAGTLVPRMLQAPDGRTSGGHQPTASSRLNRRV